MRTKAAAVFSVIALILGASAPFQTSFIQAQTDASLSKWTIQDVAVGIKPDLALDSKGLPHIAFIKESMVDGFVGYASLEGDKWTVSKVFTAYFYGPLSLAIDSRDTPHIAWHSHEGGGDEWYAFLKDNKWSVESVGGPGHDGWDNSIAVGTDGVVRTSSIAPANDPLGGFPQTPGVQYSEREQIEPVQKKPNIITRAGSVPIGNWKVEFLDSVPTMYSFGTSIALTADDAPMISYYDDKNADLKLAVRERNSWRIETVDSNGDVGRFSSLRLTMKGTPVIAYLERTAEKTGNIKVATLVGSTWNIETVDSLSSLRIVAAAGEANGARNINSLYIDSLGQYHLSYSDSREMKYAVKTASGWKIETIIRAKDSQTLQQITSLKLDKSGTPYIAFAERADQSNEWTIKLAKKGNALEPTSQSITTASVSQPYSQPTIVIVVVAAIAAFVAGLISVLRKQPKHKTS